MVRDIIISNKIGNHHYRILSFSRVVSEETAVDLGYKSLVEWLSKDTQDFADYDKVTSLVQSMDADSYQRLIPSLNYLNIYIDVLDRYDLSEEGVDETSYPVRAYLISPDNSAIAIASEDPTANSLSSAVMNLFISKISIDPRSADILKVAFDIDNYHQVEKSGSAFEFDCSNFYNYITSGNKSIKIFLGA